MQAGAFHAKFSAWVGGSCSRRFGRARVAVRGEDAAMNAGRRRGLGVVMEAGGEWEQEGEEVG